VPKCLTQQQQRVYDYLRARGGKWVSKYSIYEELYSLRPECEQPDPSLVKVYICHVRKWLPKNEVIETLHGRYRWKKYSNPPMYGFAEPICEHCVLIRVGPLARKLGDPYEQSVTGVIEGDSVRFVGYAAHPTPSIYKAAIKVAHNLGYTVRFQRIKDGIVMAEKIYIPSVNDAVNDDGTIDQAAFAAILPLAVQAFMSGDYEVVGASEFSIGNVDVLTFARKEVQTGGGVDVVDSSQTPDEVKALVKTRRDSRAGRGVDTIIARKAARAGRKARKADRNS